MKTAKDFYEWLCRSRNTLVLQEGLQKDQPIPIKSVNSFTTSYNSE